MTMFITLVLGFSLQRWWRSATREMMTYFSGMDGTQWGIIAAMIVVAGFLLLRTGQQTR